MSKVVKDLPVTADYPWDEWLDGQPRKLVQGEDFTVGLKGMACQCHNVARRRGQYVTVRVRTKESALYLQKLDAPRNLQKNKLKPPAKKSGKVKATKKKAPHKPKKAKETVEAAT